MSLLIDSQYFGSITEYKRLSNCSSALLSIFGPYQKHSFSNRMFLSGSQGIMDLTIPIDGGRTTKLLMKEVKIDYRTNWRIRHWRTIESCYRRSPWFEFYQQDLKMLYEEEFELLWKWNLELLYWVFRRLNCSINIEILDSKELFPKAHLVSDKKVIPKNYIQIWNESNLPDYQQVFIEKNGFLPNLSILDLLFCLGPKSYGYLNIPI